MPKSSTAAGSDGRADGSGEPRQLLAAECPTDAPCAASAAAPAGSASSEAESSGNGSRHLVRALTLAAVLVAAILIVHLTPVRSFLADAERVRAALTALGAGVYPVSVLAVALLVSCGIPRLLLCSLGGMAFGFWLGLSLTLAGTLLGHYLVFLFIRWGGREWALQRWPKLQKWAGLIHDQGIAGVFLVRQLPGHAMLANLCLGLSHVKHRHFLIGTALGLIPEAVPATLIGAGIVKASLKDSAGYLIAAGVALAVIWVTCGYALQKIRNQAPDAEAGVLPPPAT